MINQIPAISSSPKVATIEKKYSSLIDRGLNTILNKDTGLARPELDDRYRRARDIYNQLTDDGNLTWFGSLHIDEELIKLYDAFETFKSLAELDYGKAYFPLSKLYNGDQEIPKNKLLAQRYEQLSFNWCFNNQLLKDPEIWNDLGTLYRLGEAIEWDYTLALFWYQQAANAGDAVGMFNVSCSYELGIGVEEDYKVALDWQFSAAKAGHTTAQFGLGCQYEHDGGLLEQDDDLAFYWYLQAAKKGHRKAKHCIAKYSMDGFELPEDDELASNWFAEQAKSGETWAQYFLAEAYMKGLGIAYDNSQAIY